MSLDNKSVRSDLFSDPNKQSVKNSDSSVRMRASEAPTGKFRRVNIKLAREVHKVLHPETDTDEGSMSKDNLKESIKVFNRFVKVESDEVDPSDSKDNLVVKAAKTVGGSVGGAIGAASKGVGIATKNIGKGVGDSSEKLLQGIGTGAGKAIGGAAGGLIKGFVAASAEDGKDMSKGINESMKRFRKLAENSPLEGPVTGFNRHLKYMSPNTREILLKGHLPEIMAFAEDRSVDPHVVVGIAEASMRLGRIPDLGMYGLAGDEALAVKHFIADTILNMAEDLAKLDPSLTEEDDMSPKAKHLKLASDYKKLGEFHKRRAKEEMDKSKIAKEDGRAHSAIKANSASEEHKTLAMHCMGLADYHQIKANEMPGNSSDQAPIKAKTPEPVKDVNKGTPPAAPSKEADKPVPEKTESLATEQTTSGSLSSSMKLLGGSKAFPARPNSMLPIIKREAKESGYTRWEGLLNRKGFNKADAAKSGTGMPKQLPPGKPGDEPEQPADGRDPVESVSRLRKAAMVEDMLAESKRKASSRKKMSSKEEQHIFANVKVAPLFQALGQRIDKASPKTEEKSRTKWVTELNTICLKKGGCAAADAVLNFSLNNPWMREKGFAEEASMLRHKWQSAMSEDARYTAEKSVNAPEPIVVAIGNILRLSRK